MHQGRILVTGGAGFIGSHVVEILASRGVPVTVLDRFSSGKRENLAHIQGDVEVVEGDIRNLETLVELMARCESVVHLAAEPSVLLSVQEPIETHGSNYVGTLNVLEAMREHGRTRIVYASSAAVYSPMISRPLREDDFPDPSSPYGVDKLAGEFILKSYARVHGLQPTALRFFNIYGERQDPRSAYSGVISIFADRLSAGQPITINGTGEQCRDFVYVRDLAGIIVDLLAIRDTPPVMNVGRGQAATLLELVDCLKEVLDCPAEVAFGAFRPGDIFASVADPSLLRDCLGRVPTTPLVEGLRRLTGRPLRP